MENKTNFRDDPEFKFLENENPNLNFKELKKLYFKNRYLSKYNDYEYKEWQQIFNKRLMKIDIGGERKKNVLYQIYKSIEDEHNIDLYKIVDSNYISKLHYIFKHNNLKESFEEYISFCEEEILKTGVHKRYNVYFFINFWSKSGMYIKIGMTKNNPNVRLKAINSYNTEKWDLLGIIDNCEKTYEKELHEKFKNHRCNEFGGKEMFYLHDDITKFVKLNCDYINDKYILIEDI